MLAKSINIDILVAGTSNQLFDRDIFRHSITFSYRTTNFDHVSSHYSCFHYLTLEGGLLVFLLVCMNFFVTIHRCYKDLNVNSFFHRTARLWNFLPIECFRLTYDINGFKSRINRHLLMEGSFETDFLYTFIFFLVTPCLIVAVKLA